jgi:hypothetical protein
VTRVSLPPDAKKAYGLVSAIGTKLGERARDEPALVDALRAAPDAPAFRALVREKAEGRVPPAVLDGFLAVVRDDDWLPWRSRLLLQVKLVRDGGRPAPGHEAGKGVGRP